MRVIRALRANNLPPGMSENVLFLTPSRGLGGGIERYVETLEWAFDHRGVKRWRIDLRGSGPSAHAQMLRQAVSLVPEIPTPPRLILAHRTLLPVASLLIQARSVTGISVICHGSDTWDSTLKPRRYLENRLMARAGVRVVAASSFTAGALSRICRAAVLPPGISSTWFDTLVDASTISPEHAPGLHLVTAFRLADWRSKGLLELLAAVEAVRRVDIHLTVCGTGPVTSELRRLVGASRRCTLKTQLTDSQLAIELATADLFVLATRTKAGRDASGEGFGLVLLEAQIAGTAVIAPAYGGSHDAYIDGITGRAPADESSDALARLIEEVLKDPRELARMSRRATEWARESFSPERYATIATELLL
jgi:phosphatidylinositol alpha-1,6-mannosyltransferase